MPRITSTTPLIPSPSSSVDDFFATTPLSPTSSIKGAFVRSRPTSAEHPEYAYPVTFAHFDFGNNFATLDYGNNIPATPTSSSGTTTPTSDEHAAVATHMWARGTPADARSAPAPSTRNGSHRTIVVPLRIVRRSDASAPVAPAGRLSGGSPAGLRTWPSYKRLRKTVSTIFHRKDGGGAGRPAEDAKSASAHLRRATISGTCGGAGPVHVGGPGLAQTRAHLRRSRSFAGFAGVLAAIEDGDDDDDLDEATAEAQGVAEDVRRRWVFEEVGGGKIALDVFERCVE